MCAAQRAAHKNNSLCASLHFPWSFGCRSNLIETSYSLSTSTLVLWPRPALSCPELPATANLLVMCEFFTFQLQLKCFGCLSLAWLRQRSNRGLCPSRRCCCRWARGHSFWVLFCISIAGVTCRRLNERRRHNRRRPFSHSDTR